MAWSNENEQESLDSKQSGDSSSTDQPGVSKKQGGCLLVIIPVISYLLAIIFISRAIISDYNASGSICSSSTAGLAYLFIPIWSAIPASPFAVMGFIVTLVVLARRFPERSRGLIITITSVIPVMYLAYVGIVLWEHHRTTSLVRAVETMTDAELSAFMESDGHEGNLHILTAIALNRSAGAGTLDRLAQIETSGAHDRSIFDFSEPLSDFMLTGWLRASGEWYRSLQGKNHYWGLAVHELIALHPNAGTNVLTRLANCPNSYTVANVAINPNTPPVVLETIYRNMDKRVDPLSFRQQLCDRPSRVNASYAIKLRLAENPSLPATIQADFLAGSSDACLVSAILTNPAITPALKDQACTIMAGSRGCYSEFSPPRWLDPIADNREDNPGSFCNP